MQVHKWRLAGVTGRWTKPEKKRRARKRLDARASIHAAATPRLRKRASDGDDEPSVPFKVKDPKGGDPAEWPADLRVREFPRRQGA